MFKRDYFLLCLKQEMYLQKSWILQVFSVTRPSGTPAPFEPYVREDGHYGFKMEDGTEVTLEDAMPGQPIFFPMEEVVLKAGDLENLSTNVRTNYGTALANQLILVYAFGPKIAYIADRFNVGKIESHIEARWDDKKADDATLPPTERPIHTAEYKRFNEALGQTAGLTQLCVPSATRKTMTADPAMIKRRDELLKEHAGQLHDKVVLARIMDELTKMDRQWMKGDPGERFYIKDKAYDVARMKVFIMQGISTGFGEADDAIFSSLDEGWDINKLPAMNNQLRDGSYSRGSLTALGGEQVKLNNRIFQNSVISERDCGTLRGVAIYMTKDKMRFYEGSYQLVNGKTVLLTAESLNGLIGETIQVRNPAFCRTAGQNFCVCCVGEKIAATPQALGTYAADVGSRLMLAFMSAMHGKALKTTRLDQTIWLS